MKIYSMTATFGKLEHARLRLEPGLNVIYAPNEWGKSTWCAFLIAMLYGLDTRAKTTKNQLADKERYQPWSGSPMEGRIDLDWNGRAVTIERRTRGRIPLGEFRAYETESGLPVPELTAANCGQLLLGEGQSVFRRAGFISLSDLPVTQDDALRRRLNALVTTGDESGDADRLSQGLRDLKNRCRYNKSGLLPEAESQLDEITETLREMDALASSLRKLKERRGETEADLRELENHARCLAYAASQSDAARVAQARENRDREQQRLEALEAACAGLPTEKEIREKLTRLQQLKVSWDQLQLELHLQPDNPEAPQPPKGFAGLSGTDAVAQARRDRDACRRFGGKGWLALVLPGILMLLGGAVLLPGAYRMCGIGAAVLGALLCAVGLISRGSSQGKIDALQKKYGSREPENWLRAAEDYAAKQRDYAYFSQRYHAARGELDGRKAQLERQKEALCGSQSVDAMLDCWRDALGNLERYRDAREDAARAQEHYETLRAMAKTVERPTMADHLTYSPADTQRLLRDTREELQRLNARAGQYRGRMETLGDADRMEKEAAALGERIGKLELTYQALTIAQQTLSRASAELQRRFAPRITRRAQELIGAMTGGRYDRLSLSEDLSIQAGAKQEDTLHSVRWRSAGTSDQLYLALRLAVAEELTPESPLILDDALARCDDERMRSVLEILRTMSETRQVILFTCQQRESKV